MQDAQHDAFWQKQETAQVMARLQSCPEAYRRFLALSDELKEELIGFCEGNRGLKISYDPFFKMIFDPESHKERLSDLLSSLLGIRVNVRRALPVEGGRLSAVSSLLIMDLLAELEDGRFVNLEMQKVGYLFPGERAACYSSDLLLRQYSRVKATQRENFSYRDLKEVYTIALVEHSGPEFKRHPDCYLHRSAQHFSSGLDLNMLQEFIFVPLDIFLDNFAKKGNNISGELEAWLLFLSSDKLSDILRIIDAYPWFRDIYRELFELQNRPEELVNMFSEALEVMDRNTVKLMIEMQKQELEAQTLELKAQTQELERVQKTLAEQTQRFEEQRRAQEAEIARLKALLAQKSV